MMLVHELPSEMQMATQYFLLFPAVWQVVSVSKKIIGCNQLRKQKRSTQRHILVYTYIPTYSHL